MSGSAGKACKDRFSPLLVGRGAIRFATSEERMLNKLNVIMGIEREA